MLFVSGGAGMSGRKGRVKTKNKDNAETQRTQRCAENLYPPEKHAELRESPGQPGPGYRAYQRDLTAGK